MIGRTRLNWLVYSVLPCACLILIALYNVNEHVEFDELDRLNNLLLLEQNKLKRLKEDILVRKQAMSAVPRHGYHTNSISVADSNEYTKYKKLSKEMSSVDYVHDIQDRANGFMDNDDAAIFPMILVLITLYDEQMSAYRMMVWILMGDENIQEYASPLTLPEYKAAHGWADVRIFDKLDFAFGPPNSQNLKISTRKLPRYRNTLVATASGLADQILYVDGDLKHWPHSLLVEWVTAGEPAIFPIPESTPYSTIFRVSFRQDNTCNANIPKEELTEFRLLKERMVTLQRGVGPVGLVSMNTYLEGINEPILDFIGSKWASFGRSGNSWSGFCYSAAASGKFCKGDYVDVQRCKL
eukprot:CFRG4275T1